jgi:lactate dehydrogenase-like 2-hydroxyacid dehydrogenase
MAKEKILVTGIVPREGLDKLFDRFDVTYSGDPDRPFSREWILEHGEGYQGVLVMGENVDSEFIDAFPELKVISLDSVGFDYVDVDYAQQKGIVVSNSPQSVRVPTAEMTFALILAAAKRLYFYDSSVRRGEWLSSARKENEGMTLDGHTLGVFGLGRIGKTVAKYAQAFGMKVIYHNGHRLDPATETSLDVEYVGFDDLLRRSDVLTINTPLTPQTRGVFDAKVFARMKSTAYIVNAARGAIINERDLAEALRAGTIAGAGLDVFESEPHVTKELLGLSNVFMTPHVGTGTVEAKLAIAREATANLIAFFDGKPTNVVN